MSPLESSLLDELLEVAGLCYERGWTWGTAGNFSVRSSNGYLWQSPSGWCKGQLAKDQFKPFAIDSLVAFNPGSANPSEEMPMHAAIYRSFKKARVVVHAHPPELVEASTKGKPLKFTGMEMQKRLGCRDFGDSLNIPVAPNQTRKDFEKFSRKCDPYFSEQAQCIVLAGHGIYSWGQTPFEALSMMEAVEFLCQTT